MKTVRFYLLFVAGFSILSFFQNCGKEETSAPKDVTIKILTGKTWTVSSVNVPSNTATEPADWMGFKVSFTQTNMTTQGHPAGAEVVWPSGAYTVSDDGKRITRQDGIVMSLNPLTESNFTAGFTMPPGTEIGSRIAALEGEYAFNMK